MEINKISINNTERKKDIYAQKLLYVFRECILKNRACIDSTEIYHLTSEGISIFKDKIKDFVNESTEKDILNKIKAIQSIKEKDILVQNTSIQNFFTTNGEIELVKDVIKKTNVHQFREHKDFDELDQKYLNKTICSLYSNANSAFVKFADGSWTTMPYYLNSSDISIEYKEVPWI